MRECVRDFHGIGLLKVIFIGHQKYIQVMAGSGDLQTTRVLRKIRNTLPPDSTASLNLPKETSFHSLHIIEHGTWNTLPWLWEVGSNDWKV